MLITLSCVKIEGGNLIIYFCSKVRKDFSVGFWDNSGFIFVDKFLIINLPLVVAKVCQLFFVNYQEFSHYYRGGFEPKMTKREAGLVLGIR